MYFPQGLDKIDSKILRDIESGVYEKLEIAVARNVFDESDIVLDVGSGVGVTTLSLLKQGIKNIYCYEANPDMASYSRRLLSENGYDPLIVENAAVVPSKYGLTVDFYIRDPAVASSIYKGSAEYVSHIHVPAVRIDDAILVRGANAILCDVEGAETEIIADSKLEGIKKIVLEVHAHKSGLGAMIDLFNKLGDCGFVYDQWYSCGRVVAFRHRSIYFDGYLKNNTVPQLSD